MNKQIKEIVDNNIRNLVGWGFGFYEIEKTLKNLGWSLVRFKSNSDYSYSAIFLGPKNNPRLKEIVWSDYAGASNIDAVTTIDTIPLEIDFNFSDLESETIEEMREEMLKIEDGIKELLNNSKFNVRLYGQFFEE